MVAAMKAVEDSKMNILQAAKHIAVPRKSLENHVKKWIAHGTNPDPVHVLNSKEEDALVEIVSTWQEEAFP